MTLFKRLLCTVDSNGFRDQCYDEDRFWYSEKGVIVKWIIFTTFIFLIFTWFVGGRIHAKQRLRKGLPLLGYHRVRPQHPIPSPTTTTTNPKEKKFLISYAERRRNGQAAQNHFTFYHQNQNQNPYAPRPHNGPGAAAWTEPPPVYQNSDAPPQYFEPQGQTVKMYQGAGMELPPYGGAQQQQQQSSGVVVGGNSYADVEMGGPTATQTQEQALPPRPAKARILGVLERFRR
ncbi:hypothetical protein BDW02DRAFT_577103 [Decorospora gaudefroyi]|uniref:Uncharacterized protein n=1 Tax=Decorospora gaudefroyi TaxID=184978 RepID=A0A6A5KGY0_9PLEO|nr:hypothetical protein BDW02DRAFT_577103 [Decorospora gaudefroyi]